jgi:hypothetical protein
MTLLALIRARQRDAGAPDPLIPVATDPAAIITHALSGDGWVVVWSRMLDLEVAFVRDRAVEVPAEHTALPRFDWEELAVLVGQRPSPDRLRAMCDVKREMPGTRVVRDTGEPR